ncbi:MAG: helix-turn-helix domain-containing protein [Cyanobacteria bacterium J06600_6]
MSDLEANIKVILNAESVSSLMMKLAELLREKHGETEKKWIDSKEAMALLSVSKNTLQKLRDNRAIRVSKPPDIDKFYYDRDSILAYLDQHAVNPD